MGQYLVKLAIVQSGIGVPWANVYYLYSICDFIPAYDFQVCYGALSFGTQSQFEFCTIHTFMTLEAH